MVPEAHDPVSHAFQFRSSPAIVCCLVGMLSSVGFYDQLGIQAYKINNIRLDYHLTSKFETMQLTFPQLLPQCAFRLTGLAAQRAGPQQQIF
jgi:hypothetical protein